MTAKWVCKLYRPYPYDRQPPIETKSFDSEQEAIDFYTTARNAQRFVGPQAPYWGYPVKIEAVSV